MAPPPTAAPADPAPVSVRVGSGEPAPPRPEPPAPAVRAPIVRGAALDTAALRRLWPDVLRELKAMQPADSKLLAETEVDLDGDTVVVEFPSDQRVPMRVASEQERTARLRAAIEQVTGMRAAVRYQMGRGAVRREPERGDAGEGTTAPRTPEPTADAPDSSGPDGAAAAEPGPGPAADQGHDVARASDVGRLLIDELGAEVIAETPPDA